MLISQTSSAERSRSTGERSIKSLVSVQPVCANGGNPNDAASYVFFGTLAVRDA